VCAVQSSSSYLIITYYQSTCQFDPTWITQKSNAPKDSRLAELNIYKRKCVKIEFRKFSWIRQRCPIRKTIEIFIYKFACYQLITSTWKYINKPLCKYKPIIGCLWELKFEQQRSLCHRNFQYNEARWITKYCAFTFSTKYN